MDDLFNTVLHQGSRVPVSSLLLSLTFPVQLSCFSASVSCLCLLSLPLPLLSASSPCFCPAQSAFGCLSPCEILSLSRLSYVFSPAAGHGEQRGSEWTHERRWEDWTPPERNLSFYRSVRGWEQLGIPVGLCELQRAQVREPFQC